MGRRFHFKGLDLVARIYIYRHASVAFENSARIPAATFRTAVERYDTAPIAPFDPPQPIPHCDFVIASSLSRSCDTALNLFGVIDVSDPLFREAELPDIPPWPIRAKPTTLFAIARILWMFGRGKKCESKATFNARVVRAVDFLLRAARDHGTIGFIGHGLLNRYLVKALLNTGFTIQNNHSHEHGTYTLLTKP